MFEDNLFEDWLDSKAKELIQKIGNQEKLTSEEMIILVLKAQSNHFHHLDQELRAEMRDFKEEMKELRVDMDKRFEQVEKRFEQVEKRFEQIDQRFEQIDQRFEQVDKRFEQVDKRFEQVDKRFDEMLKRLDRFMFWSLGLVMASTFFIIKFLG